MFRIISSKRWAFLSTLLFCLGFASTVYAQSTTQGAVSGTVFDSAGAAVPGAIVTIKNDANNSEVKVTADPSGFYQAPLLEPGTYTVSVSAPGFAPFSSTGVIVQVGQPTHVDAHLAVGTASTSVQVSGASQVLNFESPDFSGVINKTTLNSLPINNRRWSALAMTTPGVVSDTNGFGLVSVRGVSPLLNNVMIDGADDNQAFYSEERGRTREAYSTSASAVQEFQINTGVYSAEYGRAAGAVINSVTASGTNQLHGTTYFWDRESNWNAFNDFSKISVLEPATGTYAQIPIKPEDLRKIWGFTVGGPIIKDKIFWMYTYDQHAHVFPGIGVPTSTSFYSLPDANLTSGTCNTANGYLSGSTTTNVNYTLDSYACTLAARQKLTYAAGAAAYDAAIAGLSSDLGVVHRTGDQEINTPKLDFIINPKEHLSLLYHRLRWASPGGVQTSSTAAYGLDTWGNDYVKLDYGVAKLTSIVKSNISNELLYQYSRELDNESQQPYSAYTQANFIGAGGNVPEVDLDESSVGFNAGSPYYSYRTADPYETKWQITDTLYYTRGNHSLKFGVDTVHNYDLVNNTYESNGEYLYDYLSNYVTDLLNKGLASTCNSSVSPAQTSATGSSVIGTDPCYTDYYQGFGPPVFAISTFDYAFFAQDNWRVSPRLTLELGVRYDYEFLPSPVSNLITATGTFLPYPQLSNHPSDKNNIGPRIGFSYDAYGTGRTVLRGGFGMYYGRITNGNIEEVLLDTGSPNGQYTTTYKATTAGAPNSFPNPVTAAGIPPAPSSYYLASNLQNPSVYESDLMVQQAVGRGTVVQFSYLGALGRELPNFLDFNLNPTTTNYSISIADPTGKGPLPNGTTYTVPTYTGYGNTALFGSVATKYQSITAMTSNVNSSYNAFVAEIQNHSLHSVQFDANYTWSHALDFAQNAETQGEGNAWYDPYHNPRINYGDSPYNVPNRFVAWAVYNFPNVHSGTWVKYLADDWNLDDSFQMQDGLPYTAEVSGFVGDAVLSDWNGASGSTLIPEIGPETERTPRKIVDDVRLQKNIAFRRGYNLQLMANLFNVANHQNIDGINEVAYKLTTNSGTETAGTATFQGGQSGAGTFGAATSSNDSGFLYTPRQVEIAARFTF